jgi:hypothetical protein
VLQPGPLHWKDAAHATPSNLRAVQTPVLLQYCPPLLPSVPSAQFPSLVHAAHLPVLSQ